MVAPVSTDARIPDFSPAVWKQFAELGWLALPIAEEFGGLGGGAVEIGILMEAFGRGLVSEPYVATVVLGAALVNRCGSAAQKQARMAGLDIVGGFNGYPAEIEKIMLGHDAIAQVAVVGVPDDRLGEIGVAFVIPRAGQTVDPDEVRAWCQEHMANFKVPRHVQVVTELPLNPSGKVMKFRLRDDYRAGVSRER